MKDHLKFKHFENPKIRATGIAPRRRILKEFLKKNILEASFQKVVTEAIIEESSSRLGETVVETSENSSDTSFYEDIEIDADESENITSNKRHYSIAEPEAKSNWIFFSDLRQKMPTIYRKKKNE